ncbi:hypothetical protein ZOSMA_133G00070 [Zostera marina]|uniref:Uncharacterized protein n=1 Tax=Zostera marina TaxID=29655 RepID=A0A0K9PYN7_ZOSMR|nr:hypothetical protein ZOSMA_133G00070 [Zostera marina]
MRKITASFFLILTLAALASPGDSADSAKLIGVAECADCGNNAFGSFKGINVAVVCNSEINLVDFKEVAVGEFAGDGKLSLQLPTTIVDKKCFAHVRSLSKTNPCPTFQNLDNFILSLSSDDQSVYVFGNSDGKVSFSRAACAQKTFWKYPYFKCPNHPWFKYLPYCNPPPSNPPPVYKNPPPVYKNPPPVYKNPPPVYKNPPPVYKNPPPCNPPPYKKPVYKSPPPVHKSPPPVHKNPPPCNPPPYKKPVDKNPSPYKPPVHNTPPMHMKPPSPKYNPPVHKPAPCNTPIHKPPMFKLPPIYKPPVYVPKHPKTTTSN